jgi:DNA (cytosine-5)-methyltransferase 1
VAALTANGVGTCGADDNQAQAGHLIAQPSTVIGGGLVHSLTSEGHDASEDGTGRGTPIVAEHWGGAFHMTQDPISSENHTPCLGANAQVGVLYSIMPMNSGTDYKAREVEVAQPLMTAPTGGNQGGDYIVQPLAIRGREGGAELEAGEVGAPANALRSAGGGDSLYPLVSISSDDTPVSFAENQRGEVLENDTAGTLNTGGGKPGQGYQAVRQETIVRRLTELECERLQGYPDGWTEGQTASARYRQLGNSVAVPCVEWIARRLIATDKEINQC